MYNAILHIHIYSTTHACTYTNTHTQYITLALLYFYLHCNHQHHLYIASHSFPPLNTIAEIHIYSEQQWQWLTNITNSTSFCRYLPSVWLATYGISTQFMNQVMARSCDLRNLQGNCVVFRATSVASRPKVAGRTSSCNSTQKRGERRMSTELLWTITQLPVVVSVTHVRLTNQTHK